MVFDLFILEYIKIRKFNGNHFSFYMSDLIKGDFLDENNNIYDNPRILGYVDT